LTGLPTDSTSAETSGHPHVPVTSSTAYSQLYSDVFRTFSEIAGSTTLLRHHVQTWRECSEHTLTGWWGWLGGKDGPEIERL